MGMKYLPDWLREMPPVTDHEVAWKARAACRDHPSEWWFSPQHYDKGKELCGTCPVLAECRDLGDAVEKALFGASDARQHPFMLTGVWAGETPHERARRRRQQPRG